MFSRGEWILVGVILLVTYVSDILGGPLVAFMCGVIGILILVIVRLADEEPPVRGRQDELPRESKPKRSAA
jgi:hypothetical protein